MRTEETSRALEALLHRCYFAVAQRNGGELCWRATRRGISGPGIESSEEQTTDRTVLFSDATIYPPGSRYLILYLDNDDPTESVLDRIFKACSAFSVEKP